MKPIFILSGTFALFVLACTLTGQNPAATAQPQSEMRCGDAVCDGPENAQKCPQDCASPASNSEQDNPITPASEDYMRKNIEISITTDTLEFGYGMTVTALISLDLEFPSTGGEAALTMGSARITDYRWEEAPGCEAQYPSSLFDSTLSVAFEKIEYYPDGYMILQAPVKFDDPGFVIEANCLTGTINVPDYPFSKTIAVFNEKLPNLSFRPEDNFDHPITWGQNGVWSTNMVIKVK